MLGLLLGLGLISTAIYAQTIIINLNYCEENVTQEGLYPHPQAHNWFYACYIDQYGMNTVAYQCPEGLWFNPRTQVCDWPWEE
ncbi:chitin binding peritrophin-A-like protein [Chitinophaga skermanii]|uniref:Chitin binding peritrophin-A-like protein n=2 Tax=Chitinophaga skermanii TaxID=331697 RepID=A0A327R2X6_9BACT|nr:chitin binding peritrophin-A-like protein [Chitinophaga skermanii]